MICSCSVRNLASLILEGIQKSTRRPIITLKAPTDTNMMRQLWKLLVRLPCWAAYEMRPPTVWPMPRPQYQIPVLGVACLLVYHCEVIMIRAGEITASNMPRRVLAAVMPGKLCAAEEQQITIPQRTTLRPRTLLTGNFWIRTP